MDDSPIDRIQTLEKAVRSWRNTSLILGAFLISGLLAAWTFARVQGQFMVAAMEEAALSRAEAQRAEPARLKAEDGRSRLDHPDCAVAADRIRAQAVEVGPVRGDVVR